MRFLAVLLLISTFLPALASPEQPGPEQPATDKPQLKQRTDVSVAPARRMNFDQNARWVVPAGTKIPIQLRQAVSTKNARAGDAIYAQTTFPVVVDGIIMIPSGTYVKGIVDASKRAGRIKGTAELQFHLTTLIYPNGYSVDLAAAIDQVPGSQDAQIKEPGTAKHDSEKGEDLRRVGTAAATGGQIGSIAGATSGSLRGFGIGGVSGIAAGALIGLLARGSDVRFEIGSGVEVSLNQAIGIEGTEVMRTGMIPASNSPSPIIPIPPTVNVNR